MTDSSRSAELAALVATVVPVDPSVAAAAREHHDRLTKPRGALGGLEALGARLAAIGASVPPPVPANPAVVVFAGDHGVLAQGVSPWPQEVTAQMVLNFCAGGAAVNVLARQAGASVLVVDVGVATELPSHPALLRRKVRPGTADLRRQPAMTRADALAAVLVGADTAASVVAHGADLLVGGDMGIGNTTPSAALISAITGRPAAEVTGRGTGIDDETLARKTAVIEAALARCGPPGDPVTLLAEVGGLEIAALAGFYLGAARARVPVIVDGVIAAAAACVAVRLAPPVSGYLVAGHRSAEPGASAALAWLGLEPLVDLGLRLGEGSGAALVIPIVRSAAAIMAEMATFDSAGVTDKGDAGDQGDAAP